MRILATLDRYEIPWLDHPYVYPAAARLSLFRSPIDWAMAIEVFGYNPYRGVPDVSIDTFASGFPDTPRPVGLISRMTHALARWRSDETPHHRVRWTSPFEDGAWHACEVLRESEVPIQAYPG